MIYTFDGLAGGSGAQRAGFNKGGDGDGDGKIRKKLSFAGAINIAITLSSPYRCFASLFIR